MPHRPHVNSDVFLSQELLDLVIDEHTRHTLPRLERLWTYYRNTLRPVGRGGDLSTNTPRSGRWYRLGQEAGLPPRIIGRPRSNEDDRADRREVVVENDIAWRLQTMVDFMFGKPVTILSTATNADTRRTIERILDRVFENSGGIALFQDIALLGHVYGHVDLVLRIDDNETAPAARPSSLDDILRAADRLRVEVVEPRRGIPILDEHDYRTLSAYLIHFERDDNCIEEPTLVERLRLRAAAPRRRTTTITEVFTPSSWRLLENGRVTLEHDNPLGLLPVVHIQNLSQPFHYSGIGEVEPLIPLQDELNTRLSDRASRVTLQSFKMYLARGIEGFDQVAVGPGQIWSTDNPDATVEEFGGDAASPGEESHIREIREAMDKTSGVPPLAGGVVQARIGNLSSANALKVTLMGILSKTARKRVTYGGGLSRMCSLILHALDHSGIFKTDDSDRAVRINWPDPLPEDVREQVFAAEAKQRLGVPTERILAELGYAPNDPGVT